jgi:hypothetical protein
MTIHGGTSFAIRARGNGGAMAQAKVTTDHDEIMSWVEARGGIPACVKRTGSKKGDPGILRIDYPGFSGEETLKHISWDEWLKAFDANNLAFLHQDRVSGHPSRFSKLVTRRNVKSAGKRATSGRSRSKRATVKRTAAKGGSTKGGRAITAGNPSRGIREGSRARGTRTSGSGSSRGAVGRGTTSSKRTSRTSSKRRARA